LPPPHSRPPRYTVGVSLDGEVKPSWRFCQIHDQQNEAIELMDRLVEALGHAVSLPVPDVGRGFHGLKAVAELKPGQIDPLTPSPPA
jgi:hypothetical protein